MGDPNIGVDLSWDINPQFSRLGDVGSAVKLGTTKEIASGRALKRKITKGGSMLYS